MNDKALELAAQVAKPSNLLSVVADSVVSSSSGRYREQACQVGEDLWLELKGYSVLVHKDRLSDWVIKTDEEKA